MSKFVKDIKGFFNFFNELRKERPWTFYSFVTLFALGIAAAVGSVLLFGVTPAMALIIAFGGLYLGTLVGYLANVISEGMEMTAWRQQRFLAELRKSHPILFWGLLASLLLGVVAAILVANVPSLAALITGNAVANYLGITAALSSHSLFAAMTGVVIWGGIAASFALQGLTDIAKDIGSGLRWCFTSNKGFPTRAASQGPIYMRLPTDDAHPATGFTYSQPVVGAGGAPAAAVTTSTSGSSAPSFSFGGSGRQF